VDEITHDFTFIAEKLIGLDDLSDKLEKLLEQIKKLTSCEMVLPKG
jgi:hypothetical protein